MYKISWKDLEKGLWETLGKGRKTALTVGVFDGFHRGHRVLISKIAEKAPALLPGVITFRENPKKYSFLRQEKGAPEFSEDNPFRDIIGFDEKMALLSQSKVALCVIIDFSENFSKINGESFVRTLHRYLDPAYIAVGANFHCGYRQDTDAPRFKALAEGMGISAEIVEPVLEGGIPVSSSRIRAALRAGRRHEAELLLGRPLREIRSARF
ncbi:MAG: FAD synthetase family protein [Spirochaetaceae bacterium]|jgi:cytidyltransferase-like protein|nr:FAD synthetase family protein [Spirochaetaceae bacterium]